jgi:hypothetical protein
VSFFRIPSPEAVRSARKRVAHNYKAIEQEGSSKLKIAKGSDEKANLIGALGIKLSDQEAYSDQGDTN